LSLVVRRLIDPYALEAAGGRALVVATREVLEGRRPYGTVLAGALGELAELPVRDPEYFEGLGSTLPGIPTALARNVALGVPGVADVLNRLPTSVTGLQGAAAGAVGQAAEMAARFGGNFRNDVFGMMQAVRGEWTRLAPGGFLQSVGLLGGEIARGFNTQLTYAVGMARNVLTYASQLPALMRGIVSGLGDYLRQGLSILRDTISNLGKNLLSGLSSPAGIGFLTSAISAMISFLLPPPPPVPPMSLGALLHEHKLTPTSENQQHLWRAVFAGSGDGSRRDVMVGVNRDFAAWQGRCSRWLADGGAPDGHDHPDCCVTRHGLRVDEAIAWGLLTNILKGADMEQAICACIHDYYNEGISVDYSCTCTHKWKRCWVQARSVHGDDPNKTSGIMPGTPPMYPIYEDGALPGPYQMDNRPYFTPRGDVATLNILRRGKFEYDGAGELAEARRQGQRLGLVVEGLPAGELDNLYSSVPVRRREIECYQDLVANGARRIYGRAQMFVSVMRFMKAIEEGGLASNQVVPTFSGAEFGGDPLAEAYAWYRRESLGHQAGQLLRALGVQATPTGIEVAVRGGNARVITPRHVLIYPDPPGTADTRNPGAWQAARGRDGRHFAPLVRPNAAGGRRPHVQDATFNGTKVRAVPWSVWAYALALCGTDAPALFTGDDGRPHPEDYNRDAMVRLGYAKADEGRLAAPRAVTPAQAQAAQAARQALEVAARLNQLDRRAAAAPAAAGRIGQLAAQTGGRRWVVPVAIAGTLAAAAGVAMARRT
jgi:hypothetical protein